MTQYNSIEALIASADATYTRADPAWADNADGLWSQFAANVIRRTDKGIKITPAFTNLTTNNSVFDAGGVVSIPANTAVLAATTLNGLPGIAVEDWNGQNNIRFTCDSIVPSDTYTICGLIYLPVAVGSVNIDVRDGPATNVLSQLTPGQASFFSTTIVSGAGGAGGFIDIIAQGQPDGVAFAGITIIDGDVTPDITVTNGSANSKQADVLTIFPDANTYDIIVTFDDDSTQAFPAEVIGGGGWLVPTNLDRPYIKDINGTLT